MRLDTLGNPTFTEQELFDALYQGHQLSSELFVLDSEDIKKFQTITEITFQNSKNIPIEEFDKKNQAEWFMPEEYKKLDIEGYLVYACPKENYQRLIEELQEFRARKMLDLLRWLKYFVDTCRANNVVWGVGRGSSVSSYVLYLIGVHRINPIKYNLNWREFLR